MRYLIKDPKCKVQSFVCPVTLKDSLNGGCDAANARFEGTVLSRTPQGKFKCACGKTLYTGILSNGVEVTRENLEQYTKE